MALTTNADRSNQGQVAYPKKKKVKPKKKGASK